MKPVLAVVLLGLGLQAHAQERFAIIAPGSASTSLSLHPSLRPAAGFPRATGEGNAVLLGVCAGKDEAQLARDLARLTLEQVEVRPSSESPACPSVKTAKAALPRGFYPLTRFVARPVVADAPSVVWRFYEKPVNLGAASCSPFELMVRVEARRHVLDSKSFAGECVPQNADSNFEAKEIIWTVKRLPVHAERQRVVVENEGFNRKLREHTRIMLAFECGRISEAASWQGPAFALLSEVRMKPSGSQPRTWERLDAVGFTQGASCRNQFRESCINAQQAVRLVWNPKTCGYDEQAWEPRPTSAELAPGRALFQ